MLYTVILVFGQCSDMLTSSLEHCKPFIKVFRVLFRVRKVCPLIYKRFQVCIKQDCSCGKNIVDAVWVHAFEDLLENAQSMINIDFAQDKSSCQSDTCSISPQRLETILLPQKRK